MAARRIGLALLTVLVAAEARAIDDPPELVNGVETDCVAAVHALPPVPERAPERSGRAISELAPSACRAELEALGVSTSVPAHAGGIEQPVRIESDLGGLSLGGSEPVVDCRLAVALATWAPALRARGVRALHTISIHRPGARVAGSRRVSGHALGLAIDLGAIALEDGTRVDVLNGWEARARGVEPCAPQAESDRSALLRSLVCAAVDDDLFQVVLTPHHDQAHANHVHLELVPGVEWSYVR